MEYVDRLIAAGRPELAEQLARTWRNAVMLCAKYAEGRKRYYRGGDAGTLGGEIPVGASKTGGYPDLPPEIPYPEMTGFARTYLKADPRWRVEIVPESSMQLLAQINLRELAESGADTEHLLPETGMLYFFYSHYGCDVFAGSKHPDPYSAVDVQDPKRAQIAKVIWWDGDMQTLRRTAPRLPYCEDVIPGLEEECAVAFYAEDNYDTEQLAALNAILSAMDGTGLGEKITAIDVTRTFDLTLQYSDLYEIKLGGTDQMDYKMQYLLAVLDQLSPYQAGTIDLSFEEEKVARFIPW